MICVPRRNGSDTNTEPTVAEGVTATSCDELMVAFEELVSAVVFGAITPASVPLGKLIFDGVVVA